MSAFRQVRMGRTAAAAPVTFLNLLASIGAVQSSEV